MERPIIEIPPEMAGNAPNRAVKRPRPSIPIEPAPAGLDVLDGFFAPKAKSMDADVAPKTRGRPITWPKISRPGVPAKPEITYYVGDEVCFSPMLGQATLFVIAPKDTKDFCVSVTEIMALAQVEKSYHKSINHIYLGANRSYRTADNVEWEEVVEELLSEKYYVSLEINWMQAKDFVAWKALASTFFCLVMRYSLAHVNRFRNSVVRIEDETFNGSNGGVWAHSIADLTVMDGPNFTPWKWFSKDKPLK